jgi:hypothetical protein
LLLFAKKSQKGAGVDKKCTSIFPHLHSHDTGSHFLDCMRVFSHRFSHITKNAFFEKKRANADVNETPSKNPNPFSRAEGSRAGHFGRARIIRESHAHLQAALEAAQVRYSIIPSPSPPHRTDPRAASHGAGRRLDFGFGPLR